MNSRSSLSPKLAGGYSTTPATLCTSFKIKGQGHKLTLSVCLISASSAFGKQNAVPMPLQADGGIPYQPNPVATLLVSFS